MGTNINNPAIEQDLVSTTDLIKVTVCDFVEFEHLPCENCEIEARERAIEEMITIVKRALEDAKCNFMVHSEEEC